jgi:hypothetical protein
MYRPIRPYEKHPVKTDRSFPVGALLAAPDVCQVKDIVGEMFL